MKKYIVLSVNDNVDYLFFTPITCWAWRKFGWEPIVMYRGERNISFVIDTILKRGINGKIVNVDSIEGYRSDTITQISRLYAACITKDPYSYLMTGDIDMIPLSNYWLPDFDHKHAGKDMHKVTVWGHDLTGFGHFPICYIGMQAMYWWQVMKLQNEHHSQFIKRDLDTLPQAKDPDFYKYWFCDQDLITARLKEYGTDKIDFINRGQYPNGFARGRVDRGAWSLNHDVFIDAHLEQQTHHKQEKIDRLMELLCKVWPQEDFIWFEEYIKEFKKLAV